MLNVYMQKKRGEREERRDISMHPKKTLAILFTMLLLGSFSAVLPIAMAHPGPYYSVEPASQTFGPANSIGTTFTVAVWLRNVTVANVPAGAAATEVKLQWNPAYLNAVSVTKLASRGGALGSGGFFDAVDDLNNTLGY